MPFWEAFVLFKPVYGTVYGEVSQMFSELIEVNDYQFRYLIILLYCL